MVKSKIENLKLAFVVQLAVALILLGWFLAISANAQTVGTQKNEAQNSLPKTETRTAADAVKTPVPVWKNYREVALGMTADAVKDKLGKAKIADQDGFYYEFSDDESAQITLDADQKVRVISVIYKAKGGSAPKFESVLGTEAGVEPRADGSVYKLVRYPEAGFWVAYNRTAGDNAVVTVTIQKL